MSGTVKLKNIDAFTDWYLSLSVGEAEEICNRLDARIPERSESYYTTPFYHALRDAFQVTSWSSYPPEATREAKWPAQRQRYYEETLRPFISMATEYGQVIHVRHWDAGEIAYLYLGNPEKLIAVPQPENYLEFIPEKDYSDLTPAEMRQRLCGAVPENALVSREAENLSVSSVRTRLEAETDKKAALEAEILATERGETGQLAELKAQIERLQNEMMMKKKALLEEFHAKREELEERIEQFNNQIFLLDAQIYSIRCYLGETVQFAQLRTGMPAPDTEPIIIHQKLRFLDEDLGRLASLYEIQWSDLHLFEDFLRYSPIALDQFAPNERCVMLVRLSRTNRLTGEGEDLPYTNMLEHFEYLHGTTVGIIVRNGENLYLGWSEEDRVHITDDLIISRVITEIVPDEPKKFHFESDRKRWIEKQREERRQVVDGIVSRNYVYNILQGVVDRTGLLPLPKGVTLSKPSEYVQFAVADQWLEDNKISFDEVLKTCNSKFTAGDMILTMQHLVPEQYGTSRFTYPQKWVNTRGRGERNRTHDCSVSDCTIYAINMVEYDKAPTQFQVNIGFLKDEADIGDPNPEIDVQERIVSEADFLRDITIFEKGDICYPLWQGTRMEPTIVDGNKRYSLAEFREQEDGSYRWTSRSQQCRWENALWLDFIEDVSEDHGNRHLYVSVPKQETWTKNGEKSTSRANFEVEPSEIINLTYMNSVWLEWAISSKKLSGWTIAGTAVDYAYGIRYLKTMLDFVRKREAVERELISSVDASICDNYEWPVLLSTWKLTCNVRQITAFQARRFAGWFWKNK